MTRFLLSAALVDHCEQAQSQPTNNPALVHDRLYSPATLVFISAMSASSGKAAKGENVKVVVRCRPLNSVEKERNDESIVIMDTKLGSSKTHTTHARTTHK